MSWTVSEPVPQPAEALRGAHDDQWPQWYGEQIASTLAVNGSTIVRTAT